MGLLDIFKLFKKKNIKTARLDSSALLLKLKDIADDPTEYKISHGAMCYCPWEEEEEEEYTPLKCSLCNQKIGIFEVTSYRDFIRDLGQIKKTGIAEVKIVCIDCLLNMYMSGNYTHDITEWVDYKFFVDKYKQYNDINSSKIDGKELLKWMSKHQKNLREHKSDDSEYIEHNYFVFLFKAANNDKPRLTVIQPSNCKIFLNFIKNRRTWKSKYDQTILLKNNINIIERLTGLKL